MDDRKQRGTFPSRGGTRGVACPSRGGGTYTSRGYTYDGHSPVSYPISYKIPEPGFYSKRSINSLPSTLQCHQELPQELIGYNEKSTLNMLSSGLTAVGIIWAFVSFIATFASCVGFMAPYWITGLMLNGTQAVHFGVFRRCNFPSAAGFVFQCGRYQTFNDIPSLSWQICTVMIGVGCIVSMFVSFTSLMACCMKDLVTRRVGKFMGFLQFTAALLIGSGCALYPLGWDHTHVRSACGTSAAPYHIGDCRMCWGYYTTIGGCGLLLLASMLSWKAGTSKRDSYGIVNHSFHARRV